MKRGWMVLGALVLVASGVPLTQVALDRGAAPRGTLALTHRELIVGWNGDENSGVSLTWSWAKPPQLDSISLAELVPLGVTCTGHRYECGFSGGRRGWMVVGVDTTMWDGQIAGVRHEIDSIRASGLPDSAAGLALRQRVDRLKQLVLYTSRLTLAAVGQDPDHLVRQWNDGKHLVLAATIHVYRDGWPTDTLPGHTPTFRVYAEPLPSSLYVPVEFAPALKDSVGTRLNLYDATIAVGSRWLPRVADVKRVAAPEWSADVP